jgi:hypothetical protein
MTFTPLFIDRPKSNEAAPQGTRRAERDISVFGAQPLQFRQGKHCAFSVAKRL